MNEPIPVTFEQCKDAQLELASKVHSSISESEIRIITAMNKDISLLRTEIAIMKLKSASLGGSIGSIITYVIIAIAEFLGKK